MRKIFVLYTGGTIGCVGTPLAPLAPAAFSRRLEALAGLPTGFSFAGLEPALDSSAMVPAHWLQIAARIRAALVEHDACVLLHGTDTMVWTASALSFLLADLGKPVIMTGSQKALDEPGSDASRNLRDALALALRDDVPVEVSIAFAGKLYRGNRSVKVDALSDEAFASPAFPLLGERSEAGCWRVAATSGVPAPASPLIQALGRLGVSAPGALPRVGMLSLYPGFDPQWLDLLSAAPLAGLVLQTYGSGTAPNDPALITRLQALNAAGTVIVAVSQVLHARVDLGRYAAGSPLAAAGVLGGADMTVSTACTKLLLLAAAGFSPAGIRAAMPQALTGELTPV